MGAKAFVDHGNGRSQEKPVDPGFSCVAGFDDMAVMGQPVEERNVHLRTCT